ncbi:MAG: hypothetical protein VKQ33_06415 [Candidatus Sericytochromatia bacterium]|nr:hypothetical protein [Candidatus Sericytochromatia bacterium]
MTSWHHPPTLVASLALLLTAAAAEPAHALLGVDARAGAALQATGGQGPALNAQANVGMFGWSARGHYWQTLTAATQTRWMTAVVCKNVSPIPMIDVSPGLGLAGLGQADTTFGPVGLVHASFSPFLVPISVEATAGASWLGGTRLVLPYSLGAKVSLFPFTGFTLRYRGFEGNHALLQGANGPELGVEIGI